MAKMTAEEKKEKMDAKKAAAKAKKAAKKAALLEKKRKQAEAKKAKREAKKAKRLARLEKEFAKKVALKEKKRLAKEKQAALKTAKTLKIAKKIDKSNDGIDIKEASRTIKLAMAQIASQMAELDADKRVKKAKSIRWMGYDVETKDGNVIVRFDIEKSKKVKTATVKAVTEEKPNKECKPCEKTVVEKTDEQKPEANKVVVDEMETTPTYPDNEEKPENIEVPAGDIYGQNGNPTGEIANIESDDEDLVNDEDEDENDEEDEDEDDFSADSRDEQDEGIVDNRREFFSQFGDDFEPNDD